MADVIDVSDGEGGMEQLPVTVLLDSLAKAPCLDFFIPAQLHKSYCAAKLLFFKGTAPLGLS